MHFSFNIVDFQARAFGLCAKDEFIAHFKDQKKIDFNAPNPKPKHIPMMTARRLSDGCKLAVDAAVELSEKNDVDAVVFSSLSGESIHTSKLVTAIASKNECSPTDFSMSVHNAAVGNYTILGKKEIPSSSVSAMKDSFMQALLEGYLMLDNKIKKVLVVDYNVTISKELFPKALDLPQIPYATALIIKNGNDVKIESTGSIADTTSPYVALDFLKQYLCGQKECTYEGNEVNYKVSIK